MRSLARSVPRFGAWAALVLTLGGGASAHVEAPLYPADAAPSVAELRRLDAAYTSVVGEIAAKNLDRTPKLAVLYEHQFAPFPNLSIRYFERTRMLMDVDRIDALEPARKVADRLSAADFVLTLSPDSAAGVRGLAVQFPTSQDPAAADRFAVDRLGVQPLRAFPVPGGEVRLYQVPSRPVVLRGRLDPNPAGL